MRKIEDSLRHSKDKKDGKAAGGGRAAGKRRLGGRPVAPGAEEERDGEAGGRESTREAGGNRDASAASADGAYLRDSRFSLL